MPEVLQLDEMMSYGAPCVLAIGIFDGLHKGHRRVLECALNMAKSENAKAGVLTFDPHPSRVIPMGRSAVEIIYPSDLRAARFIEAKVDAVFFKKFDKKFASFSPDEFAGYLSEKFPNLRGIVTGSNFLFGKNAAGNAAVLEKICACRGWKYKAVDGMMSGGERISSTRLRECLLKGDMGEYSKLAGENYAAEEERVQSWLDQPIGHLSRALLPGEKAEMALHGSPIADFLNRIQLHFSGAQLSAVGLANEIAGFRSEVSVRDIIATYPYPNTLIVCRISGKQLKQVMERSAEYFAVATDGTVQVAESFLVPKVEHYNYDYYMGAAYEIDPAAPVGNRIKNLTYQRKTVTDTDSFTLCLNNYRYSGAGGYEVYTECELVREINTEMVELILEYFKENPYVEV